MKKIRWYLIGGAVLLLLVYLFGRNDKQAKAQDIIVKPETGDFLITVNVSGELEAINSEIIWGPKGLTSLGIYTDFKITEIVPDGSIIDSGQVVAKLDPSEISNKLADLDSEVQKMESKLISTKLDTQLTLRQVRDELINIEYAMEEQEIALKEAIYEAPAVQRKAQIELEKKKRAFKQQKKNYEIKQQQAEAQITEVVVTLNMRKRRYERMLAMMDKFVVLAPKSGMLEYRKDWSGRKVGVNGNVSPWHPIVATLPDLSAMRVKTYINEIDISKVEKDQRVQIKVDAFPDQDYSGVVTEVANMGEQIKGTKAKVFEVIIKLDDVDSIIRPAMSTRNEIVTQKVKDAMYIPLECLHYEDSVSFVYKKAGGSIVKQEVKTGLSNDDHIIISQGLEAEDYLYLNIPENFQDLKFQYLEATEE